MKRTSLLLALVLLFTVSVICSGCSNQKLERTSYDITCTLDGNLLSGVEKVQFYNTSENAFSELKFNLFGNAFRKDAKHSPIGAEYVNRAYPNGISYGDMQIVNVTSNGAKLDFSICGEDKNILSVCLEDSVFPEQKVQVEIEYKLNLANVIARTGINSDAVNLANFYPILCGLDQNGFYECVYYSNGDPFFSDVADYKVCLTADSKYTVASSGVLTEKHSENGKTVSNYTLDNARSFAFVLSEKFHVLTDNSTGVEINYYYYDDQTPEKSLEYAIRSVNTFSETFGGYAYSTYSVVQTEFLQGGMEFPALVMISDKLEPNAYGEVIVHETAHQWWQTGVGNNEIEYGFLDEGLAEYSVVYFYEKFPEYGYTRGNLINASEKTYKVFCSVYDKIFGNVNTVMVRSLKDFKNEYEYVNISYVKPCIMYDYLRKTVGDETFFKGLKKYYKEYCFKNATPDDLVGIYEKLGSGTNGFFESFFDGKVII